MWETPMCFFIAFGIFLMKSQVKQSPHKVRGLSHPRAFYKSEEEGTQTMTSVQDKKQEKKERKERRKHDLFQQFQSDHRVKSEHMGYYLPSAVAMTTMPICMFPV